MKGIVHRRAKAKTDLISIYRYYAREAGYATADRFLATAETIFQHTADQPHIGMRYEHDHPALAELRLFPVTSPFQAYLIFYRLSSDGVEIVRILHGARDIPSILSIDSGIEEVDDIN